MIGPRKLLIGATALAVAVSSAAVFGQDKAQEARIQGTPVVVSDSGDAHGALSDQRMQLSENVSYSDLNLATPQGDHQLKSRIRHVANSICERLGAMDRATTAIDQIEQQTSCVNGAIDDAMDQVKQVERTAR